MSNRRRFHHLSVLGIDELKPYSPTRNKEVSDLVQDVQRKTKQVQMIIEARRCESRGEYQNASSLYLKIANLEQDEARRESYLQRSQRTLELLDD